MIDGSNVVACQHCGTGIIRDAMPPDFNTQNKHPQNQQCSYLGIVINEVGDAIRFRCKKEKVNEVIPFNHLVSSTSIYGL
jgi:hypothetical protein